jgi:hypothetical protein
VVLPLLAPAHAIQLLLLLLLAQPRPPPLLLLLPPPALLLLEERMNFSIATLLVLTSLLLLLLGGKTSMTRSPWPVVNSAWPLTPVSSDCFNCCFNMEIVCLLLDSTSLDARWQPSGGRSWNPNCAPLSMPLVLHCFWRATVVYRSLLNTMLQRVA